MISDRRETADEQLGLGSAVSETRYRILAVLPHGWSTILIEDEQGKTYSVHAATGRLAPIQTEDARALVMQGTFRVWNGNRDWAPLGRLPLLAGAIEVDASMLAGELNSALAEQP